MEARLFVDKVDLVNISASKECLKVYMLPSFGEATNIPLLKENDLT